MLTAERGDPDVVMKPFALLRIGRQCAAAQHLIARFDVVGNRPRVRSEDAGGVHQLFKLTEARGPGHTEAELSQNEEGHHQGGSPHKLRRTRPVGT